MFLSKIKAFTCVKRFVCQAVLWLVEDVSNCHVEHLATASFQLASICFRLQSYLLCSRGHGVECHGHGPIVGVGGAGWRSSKVLLSPQISGQQLKRTGGNLGNL